MATLGFAVLYGVELTILFFFYSYEARMLWRKLLFGARDSDRESSFFFRGSSLRIHEFKEDNGDDAGNIEVHKIDHRDISVSTTIMTATSQV